jgi:hypothetical protein
MRVRIGVVGLLVVSLSTPAFAGDLRESAERAAREQTVSTGSMPRAYLWTGTALFVGGMATGLYAFLNNKNGEFPEFGEADATNRGLAAAGLVAAFAGGTVLLLGTKRTNPSVVIGPRRMTVSKTLRW